MIPKVIHYCWFGGNPMPKLAKKCIKSWKKYLPDYEIIEWNESNFDINCCNYVKEAYQEQKFAYVSDYARLKIIYDNGGIYLDIDVEIIKPLDDLLKYDSFFGFENPEFIATGLGFGAVKHNKIVKQMMDEYGNNHYHIEGSEADNVSCPIKKYSCAGKIWLTQR